ncbi:MAG: hypothetical protein AAFQ62_03030 [Pseudomonadota bacterium]
MNDESTCSGHESEAVRDALRELPQLSPSRAVTARLDALLDDAPTVDRQLPRTRSVARFALAASVALAVWVVWPKLGPQIGPVTESLATREVPTEADTADAVGPSIDALMARSAYLESVLDTVPQRGRVQRVGTASTITALEDRVALIDAQLSGSGTKVDETGRTALWRERVGLMSTLVSLHAQPATVVSL